MKFYLAIVFLLSCLFSYAQLNVSLPNNISLQLLKGTVLYNDTAYTNRLADNLGINRKRLNDKLNKNTYKFKDMVLKFWTIDSFIGKDYLTKEKNSLESDFKKDAVLKEINGNQFVIMMANRKETGIYIFKSINQNSTKGLRGSISFKTLQNNKDYYLNVIEEMLKTVKFEE